MSGARAPHNEQMPMFLHRCIRVVSLAGLLIIVPAGVLA
jgi:hypothetical protein